MGSDPHKKNENSEIAILIWKSRRCPPFKTAFVGGLSLPESPAEPNDVPHAVQARSSSATGGIPCTQQGGMIGLMSVVVRYREAEFQTASRPVQLSSDGRSGFAMTQRRGASSARRRTPAGSGNRRTSHSSRTM